MRHHTSTYAMVAPTRANGDHKMPNEMGLLLGAGQTELPAAFQVACGAAILLFVAAWCGAVVLEWAVRRRFLVAQPRRYHGAAWQTENPLNKLSLF